MNRNMSLNKEMGSSLLGVLVSLGIFSILALLNAQSFRNLAAANRKIESVSAARDVESIIVEAFTSKFREYILVNQCNTVPASYFSVVSLGPFGDLRRQEVVFRGLNGLSSPPPSLAKTDLKRCKEAPFFKTGLPVQSDSFYSCLNLDTAAAVQTQAAKSKDTFASNYGAFVEVLLKIKNLQLDQAIPCGAVTAGRGFGLELFYSMHWTTKGINEIQYETKVGAVNVSL